MKHSSQELFDLAIARYIAKPEKKELLLWLLKWMPVKGYAIDSSTRNLILKNSHLFGHQLIAESLSKHLVMSKRWNFTRNMQDNWSYMVKLDIGLLYREVRYVAGLRLIIMLLRQLYFLEQFPPLSSLKLTVAMHLTTWTRFLKVSHEACQ